MGLFSSLFGSSESDAASKQYQDAINAFNAIKTPELSQLQVQLNNYVNAGQITPQQAEATLLNSNAFNSIKTDPSLTAASKQALNQLQNIGSSGGMDAIAKAQLQDITNQQNQQNQSQNQATMLQAQARGTGGSNLNTVNELIGEQGAANTAAQAGTNVAANAQQRALQAIQAAGGLGQSLQAQQYGQAANAAQAQNAIQQFNTQTQNATNLANVQTANAAQAANVANAQNVANLNTQTQNANKEYNAQQVQQQFADQAAKAQGIAGQYDQWAGASNAANTREQGANMALTGGLINAGAQAAGTAMGGPIGGQAAGSLTANAYGQNGQTGFNPNTMSTNPQGFSPYAKGGEVKKNLEDEYNEFVQKYMYGGSVKMADGGMVHIKPKATNANKADPDSADEYRDKITDYQPNDENREINHPEHLVGANENKADPDCADEYRKFVTDYLPNSVPEGYADGGNVEPTPTPSPSPTPEPKKDEKKGFLEGLGNLLGSHGDEAQKIANEAKGGMIHDFRLGGPVPGIPKVPGDSEANDTVSAKLSPGEVVLPRTVVANPNAIPRFVQKAVHQDPATQALRKLRNPYYGLEGR